MIKFLPHAFHAITHNRAEHRLVATANKKQGARLWDVRVPSRKVPQHGSAQPGNSTAMSVAWNQAGDRLLPGFHRPPVQSDRRVTATRNTLDRCSGPAEW